MTFSELQSAVLSGAFNETQRSSVKDWLNYAAGQLWNLESWTFRLAEDAVSVTTDSTAVTGLPTDLGIPTGLWNSDGDPLLYVTPTVWNSSYYGATGTGLPEVWTIVDGAIRVGPISNETATDYRLAYERAFGHYQTGTTTFTAGNMSEDGDTPVFPTETHYTLVWWARMLGKAARSDSTAQIDSQLRDEGIEFMRRNYLAGQRAGGEQWGAFDPDAYGAG